jgi:hypothetical protein
MGCLRTSRICPCVENNLPACIHDCVQYNPRTPSKLWKNFKKQDFLLSFELVLFAGCTFIGEKGSMKTLILWSQKTLLLLSVLAQCGFLKYFQCPLMRAQPRLLNALVDYWHPDAKAFMLEGQLLTPTTEDIYFLTGLSRRGDPVNLRTFPPGPHNIAELIGLHCEVGTDKVGSQVSIHKISNLSLKVIVLLIGDHWICGFTSGFPGAHALCGTVLECMSV